MPNTISQISSSASGIPDGSGASGQEDNAQIYVMNNYFGMLILK